MAIYLHETATIDRGGKEGYLEALRTGWVPYAEQTRGMRLVWMGSTIGSTANWPETMALWELRDWQHFADVASRMYTEHGDDAPLADWWRASFRFRKRNRSQVLVGAPYSPTLAALLEDEVSGTAYGFTRYSLVPGTTEGFLAALAQRVALDVKYQRRLVGAYEVAFTNDTAYAIWAHADLVSAGTYQRAVVDDGDVRDWQRSVQGMLTATREIWGFATPHCPLWPKGYKTETRIW
jgi:hypothetical protein